MEVMTAMEATPTRWNDDRLDEFAKNVDRRFDEVDKRFDKVDERFDRLEGRMENGFAHGGDRLDDMVKVLMYGMFGLIGVLIAGIASLVATQI
jgi:hypothetical protein